MNKKLEKGYFTTLITATLMLVGIPVAFAWTAAPSTPPKDNVSAPVNISANDQNKTGKLGLGGLAVFGRFQLIDGTQGVGKVLISDADGKASWGTPLAGGGVAVSASNPNEGKAVVCGGYDVKYGTTAPINNWGCVTAGSTTCPTGYSAIKTSKATINLAEQTTLCIISTL